MNNFWFAAIVIVLIFGSGFILVKSGEDKKPQETQMPTPSETNKYDKFPGVLPQQERVGKHIKIKTNKGEIEFELFGEEAPKAVSNFIFLTKQGFYNGLKFHRRVDNFVIQGGCTRAAWYNGSWPAGIFS